MQDCDKLIPKSDIVDSNLEPETQAKTRKPTKLKTRVVHVPDIKLFLASKKKERELKLKPVRDNVIIDCCDAADHSIYLLYARFISEEGINIVFLPLQQSYFLMD